MQSVCIAVELELTFLYVSTHAMYVCNTPLHVYVLYMDVTIWDSWYENKKDLSFLSLLSIAVA